ncbi:serine/threonine protein kinase [Dulcicalothrix desertica PCC 7102]|uniref:histidine kinase n=1 Tax=Dulcicalothrix desertica PCC 7102 TaxID=232991 RepID=A0A433VVP2_9CYAN|nr:ATP-binding sensor histidine kinase [Dulcicalothrix desertica]RUT10162.1 serine/threonine protein kinase [Dulcicalothrix desertica PCC 7102]TWH40857.1 putative ATPase [Dulcicalothrix desertica PCC 7102]
MLSASRVPGYVITEVIHEGLNTIVYRGVSQSKSEKVILKVLKAEYPSLEEITRLKHEYSITQNLDIEGIVKVARLEAQACHYILVSEDFGGISLQKFLSNERLSLVSFLSIAVQLTKSLMSLHTHQIIHKDIKPSNIIINPESGIVKLTDFSIASRNRHSTVQLVSLTKLEGTLAYISPEQTGRMNRTVDYRSDFYSLGVSFYEMLTGQLPFNSDDALSIIHSHIAKQAPCILDFNPNIPSVIAAIITKLMAKNAEDRYQSAAGLLADLERCLDELKNTGKITEFLPGESDRISQLNIPQKLYGREKEVETLLTAFDSVSQGESQLMLVAGYSGIGKSSLVHEVHKPIVRQRGYFISGKFDQFQRAVPYSSLIQAFQSLMRQLLVENATQLFSWKEKLTKALGNNGQVIIDVIPELELIIGVQPPVVELGAMERQNRFNQVFCTFVSVFTQQEHPLVIFLDDLQWADIASLKLMQRLMTASSSSQYLLLITAYRDNEVSPTHPFIQTVEEIKKTGATVNQISLQNLNILQVQQLVNDTLHITDDSITKLTSLLFNQTSGNPFFLTQLLKKFYQEQLLKYDFTSKCWKWNTTQIQSFGITNLSIVELMASNISKLPTAAQEVLQLAACIGATFKLDILATITEKSASDIIKLLWTAIQQGLILPLNDNYQAPTEQLQLNSNEELQKFGFDEKELEFKFLHDQVQQAAYSLIPKQQKQITHLKIGKLLHNYFSSDIEAHSIDIVNQLNIGANLLTNQVEKEKLAFLNLLASRKAKIANSPIASAQYLNIGLQLLPDNSWQTHYDLTLNLYVELLEIEYLNTNFERLQQLCEIVLTHTHNILDTIKVYELKIQYCNSQLQAQLAIDIGLDVLNKLGVTLIEQLPKDIDFEQLNNLPRIQDKYQIAALQILNNLTFPAYQTNPDLYVKLVFTMVDICIRYGNSEIAAFVYACCSLICGVMGEIDLGYEYGLLSLLILDKFNAKTFAAKVLMSYNSSVRHWKEHSKLTINPLLEAFNIGVETGDIEYACIASMYYCIYSFFTAETLSVVDEKYLKYFDYIKYVKQEFFTHCNQLWRQLALNLQNSNENNYCLIGDSFNEDEVLPMLIESNQITLIFDIYFSKSMLAYLFQQYEQAIEYSRLAKKYAAGAGATMVIIQHNFYYSLALLKNYPNVSTQQQEQYLATVTANQNKMKIWSFYCAANNQHKYDLVEAERCRVLGQYWEATQLYNSAIELASENGYIQEKAIASELASEFYLASGNNKFAKIYLTDAYYAYQQWGATAKVKDLESRYPYLTIRKSESTSSTLTNTTNTRTFNHFLSLDLATVIKASQTISSEIVINNLLAKLMHLLRENAGAQKVCFIANIGEQLFLEAVLTEDNEVKVLQSQPIDECNILPLSLIAYVQRTLRHLVLDKAIQSDFKKDIYIELNKALSILVFPIIHQSKLQGILYLENNLTKAAFTQDRIELLSVIAAQAAISIENARFYTNLENRVVERTQELQTALEKLRQTQIKLIQSEKMSSLGQLVGGVAHEINNPINFIYGNLTHTHEYTQSLFDLLKVYQQNYPNPLPEVIDTTEEIDLDFIQNDLPKLLDSMKNGAGRIKNIVLSLRNFARLDEAESKKVNIHEGIDNTLMILHQRLGNIQVIKEYANLPEIYCFPGELNQVFINLLNNAIDALFTTTKKDPTIRISTALKENNQIAISIIDNGTGIKPEIKPKIFDPFFTTKPVGQGTGLGLSISHQIVQQHQGQLVCLSELGVGTEFTILLPY